MPPSYKAYQLYDAYSIKNIPSPRKWSKSDHLEINWSLFDHLEKLIQILLITIENTVTFK